MENHESFVARLTPVLPADDLIDLELAYALGKYAHRHDRRKELDPETGQPLRYFEHPRRVFLLLVDDVQCYDPTVLIAALLHDGLEDTTLLTYPKLKRWFGRDVAAIVELLTKTVQNKQTYVSDLIARADWRCLVIKAADRLDNLRSLPAGDSGFRQKQLLETREKYFAVLERLEQLCPAQYTPGIARINSEIRDLVKVVP